MKKESKKIGCRPPYLHSSYGFPICKKPEELKSFSFIINKLEDHATRVCEEISCMSHNTFTEAYGGNGSHITLACAKNVKLISQSQKIDGHTRIGNIGGYIGLFLGAFSLFYFTFIYTDLFNIKQTTVMSKDVSLLKFRFCNNTTA